jgi:GT2 family glycosyltransferase
MPSNRPILDQDPELGVVILSAGKELGMIERCVRSVLAACERLPSSCEIIFLDNASESGIGILIAELFPQITVLRFPERVGFSTGNNAGFRLTTARLIVQLNDDTEVAEDAFVELATFFQKHPEVGAAGPRLETPAGELQVGYYARRLPTLLDIAFHLFGLNALWRGNPVARRYFLIGEEDRTRPVEQPAGAALTYRRAALFQVGLLDEDYTFAYDDVDICRRLADAGWTIFYLQEARVTHLGAVSLQPNGPRLSRHTLNGVVCYWRKHGSAFEYTTVRLMMLTSLLLRLPVELALNRSNPGLRREITSVYLDGIIAVLRSLVRPYQPQRLSVCAPIEVNTELAWEARRG